MLHYGALLMRELHDTIHNFLISKAEEQWYCDWAVQFRYWDSSDCSTGGLINCLQLYNFENCTRDLYGEQEDIFDSTKNLLKLMEVSS